VKPDTLETAQVDAFTGLKPGPFTKKTVEELFLPGTIPTQEETSRVALQIDEASGLLWQDGCAGPQVTHGYFDLAKVEADHPSWQQANADWGARAAQGAGVRGGPEDTRTSFFYNNTFAPFGRSWGAPFAPTELCPIVVPPEVCDPFLTVCPPPPPPGDILTSVPDLRCADLESASDTLTAAGYAVGNVEPNDPGPDFVVSDTNPGAGALAPPGSSVDLRLRERKKVKFCG
jgi:PASTA domain-containing protein